MARVWLLPLAVTLTVPAAAAHPSSPRVGELAAQPQAAVMRIEGRAGEGVGSSVAAGDVNGDGRVDLLVSSYSAHAYVVFGPGSATTVDLARLGPRGFRIDGRDASGSGLPPLPLAAAGDVNGDGRMDIVLGSPVSAGRGEDSGSAFVVFGKIDTARVDLRALGTRGFRIDGMAAGDETGVSVAGAGDVNGDGLADVLVGAPEADGNGREDSGSAHLVFGKRDTAAIDLRALGTRGFRIDGARRFDGAGVSVAGAGDVNGDGRADVLVGASGAPIRSDPGSAYVVFGKSDTTRVDLLALGTRGFRIDGAAAGDDANNVAGAGDVNGDGRTDVLVGALDADNNGRRNSGSAYVVFGKTGRTRVDLRALGAGGFRIDGAAAYDRAGGSLLYEAAGGEVAGAGDVNGDGLADVLAAAVSASNNGRRSSGAAYVVFGKADAAAVDLATLGARGFRIDGAGRDDAAGDSVASAGDVNGDGRADVLVGAPGAGDSGAAYVVFGTGRRANVDLSTDTVVLKLVLGGPQSQRVLRQEGVAVSASCNEACSLRATGAVRVDRVGITLALRTADGGLNSAGRRTLRLSLPRPALRRLERLLREGYTAKATVTVRALDRAGNARSATRSFRLIP